MKTTSCHRLRIAQALIVMLAGSTMAHATVYTWDNWSGDSSFQTANNWVPVSVPGATDTAIFNGVLAGSGIGNYAVNVANGTAIDIMQVIDTATVDMTIGDGTTASRFDLDNAGNSLVIGDSPGDTAAFTLLGGWLDTYQTSVGGRASFNVVGDGTYWDSTEVQISGDTISNTAGIGVGQSAMVDSSGADVYVGSNTGSGRIVVDGAPEFLFGPSARWDGIGTLDVGPAINSGFNFGSVELRSDGQMWTSYANVHGTSDVASSIVVKTGADLTVDNQLDIGLYGALELTDPNSSISVGQLSSSGGSFSWSEGTLAINGELVRIDSVLGHSVLGDNLTIGAGQRLEANYSSVYAQSLDVGYGGTGTLTIQDGGQVKSNRGTIGGDYSHTGTVTVDGAGSVWDAADLRIGQMGSAMGYLYILNGGRVSASNRVMVAGFGTSTGVVVVNGSTGDTASTLDVDSSLAIGGNIGTAGGTGSLTLNNGGRVEVATTLKVWGSGTVTINSPSAIVADKIDLAPGATFNANAGSAVYTNQLIGFGNNPVIDGNVLFGQAEGSSTASHNVGSGQSLNIGSNLVIGVDKAATLTASSDGYVQCSAGFIGGAPGSDGSVVTIGDSGTSWRIYTTLNVGGDGYDPGGVSTLLIENDGLVHADGLARVWPGSVIAMNGATLIASDVELAGGVLEGTGAVQLGGGGMMINEGLVIPGFSTGVIDVLGSYTQSSNGTLHIELAGNGGVPGVDHDQLSLTGSASLAGDLTLAVMAPYSPWAGDDFRILSTGSGVSGRFEQVHFPYTGVMMLVLDYSDPYAVWVRTELSGDLNADGFVGLDDLDIVLMNWNKHVDAGVPTQGDVSGDGFVGLDDLDIVLNNWNAGTPPNSSVAVIPEPAAIGVFACGLAFFITQRKK